MDLMDMDSEDRQVTLHIGSSAESSTEETDSSSETQVQDQPPPGIAIITLNRPKAANSLGKTLMQELSQILHFLHSPAATPTLVRCVIVKSCSNKVFCAGADLKERRDMNQEEALACVDNLRNTFEVMANLPMPVIAALEGVAVGGGLELALAADIRICGDASLLGLVETSLAILPGAGGTQRLPRLVGEAVAKELIFTAQKLDADTAIKLGIVQHKVGKGMAFEKALFMAKAIAKNGPLAIRAAKHAIQSGLQQPNMSFALDAERQGYASIIPTKDRLEGLDAFREGRAPEYKGQ